MILCYLISVLGVPSLHDTVIIPAPIKQDSTYVQQSIIIENIRHLALGAEMHQKDSQVSQAIRPCIVLH